MSSEFDRLKRRQKLDNKQRRKHGNHSGDSSRIYSGRRDIAPDKKRGAKVARWED